MTEILPVFGTPFVKSSSIKSAGFLNVRKLAIVTATMAFTMICGSWVEATRDQILAPSSEYWKTVRPVRNGASCRGTAYEYTIKTSNREPSNGASWTLVRETRGPSPEYAVLCLSQVKVAPPQGRDERNGKASTLMAIYLRGAEDLVDPIATMRVDGLWTVTDVGIFEKRS